VGKKSKPLRGFSTWFVKNDENGGKKAFHKNVLAVDEWSARIKVKRGNSNCTVVQVERIW